MKKAAGEDLVEKLKVLGEKQGSIRLQDLASEMRLSPEETLGFLRQVFPVGTGIEVYHKETECWVDIKSDSIQYMLPLSPAEWILMQDILSNVKGIHSPAMNSLKKKVSENGPVKVVMELLNELDHWDYEISQNQQQIVQEIEVAIQDQQLILIEAEKRPIKIFPCRVLHLEGQLSLIGEDYQDHCLMVIPLSDVKGLQVMPTQSQPRVTIFEVEEFISAVRSMSEQETRLILKIHDPESTNLFPDHHFLGKPCMITNPEGDLIWAAYVEPCEGLFDWLLSLGKKVEILDPNKFKEQYLMYCEEKLRKIA